MALYGSMAPAVLYMALYGSLWLSMVPAVLYGSTWLYTAFKCGSCGSVGLYGSMAPAVALWRSIWVYGGACGSKVPAVGLWVYGAPYRSSGTTVFLTVPEEHGAGGTSWECN